MRRRRRNAPEIPGLVTRIEYRRMGRGVPRSEAGQYYHDFTTPVRMKALPDGSVKLVARHRLHADDAAPGFARYVRASERHAMRNARRSGDGNDELMGLLLVAGVVWWLFMRSGSSSAATALPSSASSGTGGTSIALPDLTLSTVLGQF